MPSNIFNRIFLREARENDRKRKITNPETIGKIYE